MVIAVSSLEGEILGLTTHSAEEHLQALLNETDCLVLAMS